ncbi:hypothetical protein GGR52DRAFT_389024 [Hypoxylon sp. FL1284]|nr:hypothetical protein GGR52DRAFT_389024 [Hypoxylon sp. FL1284]
MSSAGFKFLNSTGSGLSREAAKEVRSHITRTNFAKRRQRIAEAEAARRKSGRTASEGDGQLAVDQIEKLEPSAEQAAELYRYALFFSKFWSLAFLDGTCFPGNDDEAAWVALITSEPALIESTMAVGMRYWAPSLRYQRMAEDHSSRATNFIIQHITSGRAHTAAVLAAVLTMAFGARLVHDDAAWNVHVDGLASLVAERYAAGRDYLPQWFYDVIILDSINDVLGFPRFFHKKIVEALRSYDPTYMTGIAAICQGLARFQQSVEIYRQGSVDSNVASGIEETYERLLLEARAPRESRSSSIQAASLALEIILYLSWRPECRVHLAAVAEQLRQALSGLLVRPCSMMTLTSCSVMIGAVAAERGSETRAWFVSELRNAASSLKYRGWVDPLEVLKNGFVADSCFVEWLRALWEELR